jgi:hypothetical protein
MGEAPAQAQQPPQPVTPPQPQNPPPMAARPQPVPAPVYTQPGFQAGATTPPPKGSKYAVMGTLAYIGHFLLFAVPVVGLIFAIKWAFSSKINQNRRNLARAMLIFAIIGIIAGIFLAIAATAWINSLLEYLRETTGEQFGGWGDLFNQFKDIQNGLPSGLPGQ